MPSKINSSNLLIVGIILPLVILEFIIPIISGKKKHKELALTQISGQ